MSGWLGEGMPGGDSLDPATSKSGGGKGGSVT